MKHSYVVGVLLAACSPAPAAAPPPVVSLPDAAPLAAASASSSSDGRATPDAPFRADPPPPESRPAVAVPPGRWSTLSNGMRLLIVERPSAQLTAADLVFAVGPAQLPKEAPALFHVMMTSTFYGTASASQRQIFSAFEGALAEYGSTVADDYLRFDVRAPKAKFDDALSTLADLALHASFPAQHVERERQNRLAYAAHESDNVSQMGRRALELALFGAAHPYARSNASEAVDLQKVKRDGVLRAWRETFQPTLATLVVVGNVDPAAMAAHVDSLFGAWKSAGPKPSQSSAPAPSPMPARIVVVDRPGEPRSYVLYGGTMPSRAAPDYVASVVANSVFGGLRSGELARRLRDELGATSEDTSAYLARRGPGTSWVEASVAKDKTAPVLAAFDARARDLHDHGPSPDELASAKARVAGTLPRAMETAGGLAELFAAVAEHGLPQDFLSTLGASVDRVTSDDVERVEPPPEQMRAVVVGDWAELRSSLTALGWGAVEVLDANGAPVTRR
jgi:zinc protease